ncbi:MAG: glycoside hydrolase family 15 protein [Stellaceae bacterium]
MTSAGAGQGEGNLDLGVIGNSVLAALIDRRGRYVWCCFPRLDSDPVFCGLLKDGGADAATSSPEGCLSVELERFVKSEQRYLHNSAILVTTFTGGDGQSLRITDFAPRFKQYERIFRPRMLVRRIEPIAGTCRIRLRIRPLFEYGSLTPQLTLGSNHLEWSAGSHAVRVTTDGPVSMIAEERWFILDAPLTLMFGTIESVPESVAQTARQFYERTLDYWQEWVRYLSIPFEWQDAVIRAAITLKLCSFEETGGIVAALTTSIPEAAGTARNWDYRYCWLRDSHFVVYALNILGATRTMEDFIRYITDIAALDPDGPLRPVYSILPGTPIPEYVAASLPGFRGMGPVRIGNLADQQIQNDGYGSVIMAAAQMFFDHRVPLPGGMTLFHRLEKIGDTARKLAFTPDAGLWEYRGRTHIHTHSVMMSWAACDRLAKIAEALGLVERQLFWHAEASRIRARLLDEAWNPKRGTFVESFGGDSLDASLLLMPELGLLFPTDQRFLSTLDAIERELKRGHHLFRYVAPDDFGTPTNGFTIATFWYINALATVGRTTEAREAFDYVLQCRNHLGLLSEGIDPVSNALWGNFPQTYSLVGLIVSAWRLSKSWEEAFWRGS